MADLLEFHVIKACHAGLFYEGVSRFENSFATSGVFSIMRAGADFAWSSRLIPGVLRPREKRW